MLKESCLPLRMTWMNLISVMLSFIIILNMTTLRGYGQATDIRVINPQTDDSNFQFYTNETSVGTRFNLTIYVYNVIDLYTFQVRLYYNTTLLHASRGWIPPDNPDYIFYDRDSVEAPVIMNDPVIGDAVQVGGTLMGEVGGVEGTGLLAILEFEVVYAEEDIMKTLESVSCDLDLDNSETFLWDSNLEDINTDKTNGHYQYTWVELSEPYLEAVPRRQSSTKLEAFNITVWLRNIRSVHSLVNITFRLSYNNTLLSVNQVAEGSFLGESGDTDFIYTIDIGNLTVVNRLRPPYDDFPEGEGEIAVVTFEGAYQDSEEHSCDLIIHDIQLLDYSMTTISIKPELTRNSFYTISPATSTITLSLPQKVVIGSNVIINGTISPKKAGAEVTIYYKTVGMIDWDTLTTATTDDASRYIYTWKPSEVGFFEFYTAWLGDNSTLGAESITLSTEVKAKQSSTISIDIVPGNNIVLGNNLTITGEILPQRTNVNVTIHYKPNGEEDWILLGTAKTDSDSNYNHTWTTPDLGKYEIKSSWAGDASTLGATSSTKTIQVVEELPLNIMDYLPYAIIGIAIVIVVVVLYFKKFKKG